MNKNSDLISQQLINTWENNQDPYTLKDINSKYLYANIAFYKLINLSDDFNIIGLTDYDIPNAVCFLQKNYIKLERKVFETQKRVSSIESHIFNQNRERQIYLCDRTPIFNDNNQLFALSFHYSPYMDFSSNYYINEIIPNQVNRENKHANINSEEIEILSLFSHSMTMEEISQLLDIEEEKIEVLLLTLCQRFNLETLDELMDYCITRRLHSNIPEKIMPKGTHELL